MKRLLLLFVFLFSFLFVFGGGVYASGTPQYVVNPTQCATKVVTPTQENSFLGGISSPVPCFNTLTDILTVIRNALFLFVGLIFAIMFTYGGFIYMTARDDQEAIKKAQSIILYAIIGVAVIALSAIIVAIVTSLLGISLTNVLF